MEPVARNIRFLGRFNAFMEWKVTFPRYLFGIYRAGIWCRSECCPTTKSIFMFPGTLEVANGNGIEQYDFIFKFFKKSQNSAV